MDDEALMEKAINDPLNMTIIQAARFIRITDAEELTVALRGRKGKVEITLKVTEASDIKAE
ncbi:hypothetical protein [Bilophila wadsworthia]|uniref:hypothetical protein n=1 Tax=Bilophila wadsworthia TaxID=35833 RepID=UPI001DA88B0C|nr:hypothetical protein [Bilophila wadsworthia]MBS5375492.1 hypothetical protein [Bilophila wadsworthia]